MSIFRAMLILWSVRIVIFVLPASIRDILAFSKSHWLARSFWVISLVTRNAFILAPRVVKNLEFVIQWLTKYLQAILIPRCLKSKLSSNESYFAIAILLPGHIIGPQKAIIYLFLHSPFINRLCLLMPTVNSLILKNLLRT